MFKSGILVQYVIFPCLLVTLLAHIPLPWGWAAMPDSRADLFCTKDTRSKFASAHPWNMEGALVAPYVGSSSPHPLSLSSHASAC